MLVCMSHCGEGRAASLHSIENIRASATCSVPLFPFMPKGEGQRAGGGIFASSLVFLFFSFSWCQCNHSACRRLTICPGRKRAARIPGATGSQHGVQSALVHGLSHVVAGLVGTDGARRTGVVTTVGTGGWLKREKRRKKKKKIASCETFVGRE